MNCKNKSCIRFSPACISKLPAEVSVKDFDLASALESVYPLLEIVFGYLGVSDLKNAGLAKKSWTQVVDQVLKKRNKLSWMTVRSSQNGTELMADCSEKFCYYQSEFGIILYKSKQAVNVCFHDGSNKGRKMTKLDFLDKYNLLNDIDYCVVKCPKIDSTPDAGENLIDVCLLPKIPNVRIASIAYRDCKDCCKSLNVEENETVKCVLFFQKHHGKSATNILKQIVPIESCDQVAVGGGVIDENQLFLADTKAHYKKNLCIAFLEDKNHASCLSASSIVISDDDWDNLMTPKKFEDTLIKFKQQLVLRKNSVAFKFVCSCNRDITESEIFKRIFPDTKLMGLHVYGEFGWNCFNNSSEADNDLVPKAEKILKRGCPKVTHEFSTVIVVLTWGERVQ